MNLSEFFARNPRVALAFSGGVDSSYLLYAALSWGAQIRAYYVKTAFQPQFERNDALRLAEQLCADLTVLEADVLCSQTICSNPPDRCYHCKRTIFTAILEAARQDGFSLLIDGTNASDDEGDRPGIRALRELAVRSPLRECGLTKDQIRSLSRQAGLFTWDKPAYACLATRIPTGEAVTADKLTAVEQSEAFLSSLGFRDFRVRTREGRARLQVSADQLDLVLQNRERILLQLQKYYSEVTLDLEVRT